MSYAVFFDKDGVTYRLPVNPEQIEVISNPAIEKYEILKLGQIAVPTHMELTEYSFECELPFKPLHYIETAGDFKNADFYLNLFKAWREKKEPVRFIASNGIGDDINSLVLIEELTITEKAGEEGDKYVSFRLVEYRPYGKKTVVIPTPTQTIVKKDEPVPAVSLKANDYHVVQPGDTLWGIAKKYYGNGNQYQKIYEANKNQIKNPNLIYPGQKLVIPR